jgi:3-oxoacyl-[acyl-carrier protein] reductase
VGISRRADDWSFPGESLALDLADRGATQAVLADLTRPFAFDGLVNNVGLVRGKRLGEITLMR